MLVVFYNHTFDHTYFTNSHIADIPPAKLVAKQAGRRVGVSSSRAKEGLRIGARGGGDEAPLPFLSIPPPAPLCCSSLVPLLSMLFLHVFPQTFCIKLTTILHPGPFVGLHLHLCFLCSFCVCFLRLKRIKLCFLH